MPKHAPEAYRCLMQYLQHGMVGALIARCAVHVRAHGFDSVRDWELVCS